VPPAHEEHLPDDPPLVDDGHPDLDGVARADVDGEEVRLLRQVLRDDARHAVRHLQGVREAEQAAEAGVLGAGLAEPGDLRGQVHGLRAEPLVLREGAAEPPDV